MTIDNADGKAMPMQFVEGLQTIRLIEAHSDGLAVVTVARDGARAAMNIYSADPDASDKLTSVYTGQCEEGFKFLP